MALTNLSPETTDAEALANYFKELAGGSETEQAFLIQGMMGTGVAKVEGVGEDQGAQELVELTQDALVGMLASDDPEVKNLAIKLGLQFYQGSRSARHAAIETSETPE